MLHSLNRGWCLDRRESVGGNQAEKKDQMTRGMKLTPSAGKNISPKLHCELPSRTCRSIPTANPCVPCNFVSLRRQYSSSSSIYSWHPIAGDASNPDELVEYHRNGSKCEGAGDLFESLCCHGRRCFGRCIVHLSGFCCFGEPSDIFWRKYDNFDL
jgi:hypothetical protein